jgi:hypothetical protein
MSEKAMIYELVLSDDEKGRIYVYSFVCTICILVEAIFPRSISSALFYICFF